MAGQPISILAYLKTVMNPQRRRETAPEPSPEISVFMPVRNDEQTVEANVKVLRQGVEGGRLHNAVVVVDGSTDNTPQLVSQALRISDQQKKNLFNPSSTRRQLDLGNGILLVWHKQPLGKGRNFVEAMRFLASSSDHFANPNSVVVNVDADALDLTEEKILGIAGALHKTSSPMVLGRHVQLRNHVGERPMEPKPRSVGFRAIRADALKPLLAGNPSWVRVFPRQFGMDYALNLLVQDRFRNSLPGGEIPFADVFLLHLPAGRHANKPSQSAMREGVKARFEQKDFLKIMSRESGTNWADELAFREEAIRIANKAKSIER